MKQLIKIKRIYEEPQNEDGLRVLVDRLWPRGMSKQSAAVDVWAKELAPSVTLRKWFNHTPGKWSAFQSKYEKELQQNDQLSSFIEQHKKEEIITLLFGAKDIKHTHAIVLQNFIQKHYK